MEKSNADGTMPRCACHSSATLEIAPRTKKHVAWNVCTTCMVALFRRMLDEAGECVGCAHSTVLHAGKGCRVPMCRCKVAPNG